MTSSTPTGQQSLMLQMTQRLPLSDAHFRRICQFDLPARGNRAGRPQTRHGLQRLVRRLRLLGLDDFGRYLGMLEANSSSAEWQAFINSLTTNLTAFFREGQPFPDPCGTRPQTCRGL
ncbi:Chemotaxis protein methyltransferase [Cedecea neteri]|uniref:Chemotaxis protein methyltransferase n=1 Tax=Cedecea neteri TaxID=158822 RepID=A0A2X3KTM6_9ENTR|nr:Chemotaxis protein methyltransferase [Cedecea neteri]